MLNNSFRRTLAEKNRTATMTFVPVTNLLPRERRVIRNMASALCVAFHIAEGRALASLLGIGGERSNQEALETWVCKQMLTHQTLPSQQTVSWFIAQLEYDLDALEVQHA